MPIYEYRCLSCQHRFEVRQKMSDAPVSACVRCGKAVTRLISPSAIKFKGSGWYVTDYSDKLKPPAQSESEDKPADGKKKADAAKPGDAPAPQTTGSAGTTAGTGSSPGPAPGPAATPSGSSSSSSPKKP
jgi:putative FmdB family regulatory protein